MGWIRLQDEAWDVTVHRMKDRVEDALLRHPVMLWKERIAKYLWKFIVRVKKALCGQSGSQMSAKMNRVNFMHIVLEVVHI